MSVQDQVATEVVQYEVEDGVATIWLNRPEVKNCVNWDLLTSLGAALDRADDDDDVRVVLIRGRGNTFCAGADLNMLDAEFLGTTNNSVKIAQVSARTFDRAFNLSKPTIAVVEGYAVAGGFELMISCDFCIAADNAQDRRLPHPPRALRRRRSDLPPPALHRPAQDQGAAVHGQARSRAASARSGAWPTSPPRRRARPGDRRLHRPDEGQERVHACASPSSPPTAASTATPRR